MRTLIGRDHPAGILRAEIGRAVASHGGLVLVTGEAGIGKTSLITGAAEDARELGAVVLSGSCWDSDSAPGYWPWVQVVRALRRATSAEERAAAEDAAGPALGVLLGESTGSDPVDEFRLYDAVTTALVALSQQRPVVVVLDDLHWADAASLKLLEFAARHTWFERLLIIGSYRDVEVEPIDHPLRPLILPLLARATTVTLTGLGRDEVGTLIESTLGREPDGQLITEVYRRTGGNPFFVEQTARLWQGGGSVTAIAPGVREAVRRRLSLLPEPVVSLLGTAAVLGREFHRQLLAGATAEPVPQVDRLLDEAVAARLVVGLGAGSFAFAHDLVRETLYEELSDAEAARQHAAVVWAADGSPALRQRLVPADLARHAYLAGTELDPDRAVDVLLAAAKDAGSRMANDEAIGHYRRAAERAADGGPSRRILIALELGRALQHGSYLDGAWQSFHEAAVLARELDDPALLARVALVLYGVSGPADMVTLQNELLVEAYGRLVPEPGGDAPLEHLAQELAKRVAALARGGDDDETLGFGLWARHNAILGPGTAAERLALTDELLEFARRTGDLDAEHQAASFRWVALLEQGNPRYLEQLDTFVVLTERVGMPLFRMASYVDRSIVAGLTGRFAEAHALLDTMTSSLGDSEHIYIDYMEHHIRWSLLLSQGRFDEVDGVLRILADRDHPQLWLLEGITAVQRGDVDGALRVLAEMEPPDRLLTPLWLRFQAQTAAASRDPELCERARAALAPYAGEWAVSLYGCDVSGPMVLWSAMLDAAQERWDEAIAGFTAAVESAERLRARPWVVEARAGLGAALLARGDQAGTGVLAEARREAEVLGMRHILASVHTGQSTMDSVAINEFRLVGDVWSLGMGGRTVHMPDAKGLRDLHTLIGRPGTDIRAVELLDPDGGAVVVAARSFGGDEILDEQARAAYRRRLAVLDEEIDRISELGDDHKAVELDRERATLLDELRAAAGLAGRGRRLGDEAERARKTVTARIRDTLRKLDDRHPALAAHLRATVSTGAICRYQPEDGITWRR